MIDPKFPFRVEFPTYSQLFKVRNAIHVPTHGDTAIFARIFDDRERTNCLFYQKGRFVCTSTVDLGSNTVTCRDEKTGIAMVGVIGFLPLFVCKKGFETAGRDGVKSFAGYASWAGGNYDAPFLITADASKALSIKQEVHAIPVPGELNAFIATAPVLWGYSYKEVVKRLLREI